MKSVNLALPPITVPLAQIAGWTVRTTFTHEASTAYELAVNANELVIFLSGTGASGGSVNVRPWTPYPKLGAKIRCSYPTWMQTQYSSEFVREIVILQIESAGTLRWETSGAQGALWGVVLAPSLVSSQNMLGQREIPVDDGYSLSSIAYGLELSGGWGRDASAVAISLHGLFIQDPYSWHPDYIGTSGTATMTRVYGDVTPTVPFQVLVCTGAGTVFPANVNFQGKWWVFNPRSQVVSLA